MKCKQKVNTPPIPSLLASQKEAVFGESIDNDGEPLEKIRAESSQTSEKQEDTRFFCQLLEKVDPVRRNTSLK